jgi:superfamily II DNA or RNA helicase
MDDYAWPSDFWPHQLTGCQQVVDAIIAGNRRIVLTSPTGMGKCLAPDTTVLMYDGAIREAWQLACGDRLMGPDSMPRTILSTTRGCGQMYTVFQKRGDYYEVNTDHILSLKMTGGSLHSCGIADGTVVNITIAKYLASTKTFRHCAKGYKVAVDFPERQVHIHPYLLGLWLGDGTSASTEITVGDDDIRLWLTQYANRNSLLFRERPQPPHCTMVNLISQKWRKGGGRQFGINHFRNGLLFYGLLNNKHIPHDYLANSREMRLQLLAGLIDSGGSMSCSCYDLIFVNHLLADGCAFLARSVGLSANIKLCNKTCCNNGVRGQYYRVCISGNSNIIPVLIERKQARPRLQIKNHLLAGIKVRPSGLGDYCGFEIDGDGLFLLGDFTVTHNSRMMAALIEWARSDWQRVVLYTHRRMLFGQTSRVLTDHGVEHGLRAAGHKPNPHAPVQLAMTQSEVSAIKRGRRAPHDAALVLTDELHAQGGDTLPTLHDYHHRHGAAIGGLTATPIDLEGHWDRLIVAGKVSDGRKCGALVPAYTFCPDFPDLRHIKKYRVGEDLTDKENSKVMMRPGVFGRVLNHWKELNPKGKPTILFAPDVAGSIYFAEQFHAAGYRSAHIDAKQIWYNGDYFPSDDETRDRVVKMTETGEVQVLSNRFVLREGWNAPHIAVCIMACVFGSLRSYIQAGGRALRAHPSLDRVVIIDHGGNYLRHGSLNEDRDWELGMTGYKMTGIRQEAMREHPEIEPIICPKCGAARLSGPTCHACGHTCHARSRLVVQVDGSLKPVTGPSFKPRRVDMRSDTDRLWRSMYHRAASKKWNATFNQAEALFFYENRYYPPRDLPLMPVNPADHFERVADVPKERLR